MINKPYRHTQTGYLLLAALGAALLLMIFLMVLTGFHWVGLVVLLVLAVCMAICASLTTQVDETVLEIRFGPGLIRKRFPLSNIASCRAVTNPWYYGWGIHLTPAGWLYNVSGFQAVELVMKNGKKVRIGTDDPKGLVEALQSTREIILPSPDAKNSHQR